jgi:hypothetical protein
MTPDLIIQDISWYVENQMVNDDVNFIVTIKNQGSDTAAGCRLMYSIDGVGDLYEDVLSIPPQETAEISWITFLEAGEHTIVVTIDNDDSVNELDETNNEGTLTFTTIAPDLIVRTITWAPLGAKPGEVITIAVDVENQGRAIAENVRLALSIDGSPVDYVDIEEIDVGDTARGELSWTTLAGLHEISVLADIDGIILETDETNNTKSRSITIIEPESPSKMSLTLSSGSSSDKGLLEDSYWLIMLGALLLGGSAFMVIWRAIKKK